MTTQEATVSDGPTIVEGQRFDNPEAYIPRDRRIALAAGTTLPDRVVGAGVFADISGFTPLTEALATELGPQRGAEVLTAVLGDVISAVIEELDRYGGDVIYFSGDAITCWIDGDDGTQATACALAMQTAMARVGAVTTPGGRPVTLAMKVAIAVGPARRFVIGVPRVQLIDVLAGRLVDQLADAEHHAEKGEVVLDETAIEALGDRVEILETRVDPATGRRFGVVGRLLVDVAEARVPEPPPLPESVVRQWLLPAVYERMRTGRGEFLAELRAAYPFFVRFGGIDYDDDDEADDKLNDFVVRAQEILDGFGGNVLQLTLGDKGAYLYGVFGSPHAHEDDAARAASAALEVLELEGVTAATDIQVGIAHGRLRSGTYGHPMRRTFVCLGDAVNLSARLMSAAPPGRIYVSGTVHDHAEDAFTWDRLPSLTLKGKSQPVDVYALTGTVARKTRRQVRYELPLVGRVAELQELDHRLDLARQADRQAVGLAAEAGMGKSRLLAEFARNARRAGLTVAFGECQAFGTTTSYLPWREIWRVLFGVDDGASPARQRAAIERALAAIDPELVPRAPLLEPVVDVPIPENELTTSFDPKLRKASVEDLLSRCLVALADEPLVIVLEDCHWIDELSKDLLVSLVRATADSRVCFVLAYRPAAEPGGGLGLDRIAGFGEVELVRLDADDTRQVIRSKLVQLVGDERPIPDALVDVISTRSEGNPFYIEELLNYLVSRGVDLADHRALAGVEMPNSLQSLILGRIDQLEESPRRTLKVASVIGRVFEAPVLPRVYPEIGRLDDVLQELDRLRTLDLVAPERSDVQSYLFRHVLIQTVAYESMPFALRSRLHRRVGEDLEGGGAETIERQVDLLAHHFWHSDDDTKKRDYLWRAAEAAQARYANGAAIEYLERLVPLLDGVERIRASLALGRSLELTGAWQRAEEVDLAALELAIEAGDDAARAQAESALAEVARKQGRYDDATTRLDAAEAVFRRLGDEAGIGQVLHLAGTVAAQRGDYETARRRYRESLAIRERRDEKDPLARLLANLAIIAEYEGDFAESRRLNLEALDIRTELGDRWAIAMSQNNLGMIALHQRDFAEAATRFEESVRLGREVGDPWVLALGDENRGNARRGLGDYAGARAGYAAAMRAFLVLDDRWDIAFLLEYVAILATAEGAYERAIELVGAAERLREEIGAGRAPALADELARELAPARTALGPDAVGEALRRGRECDLEAAAALALEFCEGRSDGASSPG